MTPAPISVERLRELLDKASEWRCTGDVLRCTDGNGCECDLSGNPSPWMDLQNAAVNALPALLQQLAEMSADLEREQGVREDAQRQRRAAERAREEACKIIAELREYVVNERDAQVLPRKVASYQRELDSIDAFLAASGGGRED